MAYIPDAQSITYRQFKGSAQAADPYAIDMAHGLYAQNIDFVVGPDGTTVQTRQRYGVSQIAQLPNSDGAVTAMANWYYTLSGSQVGIVVYYAPAVGVKSYNQGSATFSGTRVSVTSAAFAAFAFNGIYAYIAFGNSSGRVGTSAAYVLNDNTNNADQLFTAPSNSSTISWTINTTAGAGVVTAGTKRVAFLATTRSGFTILCPISAWTNGIATLAPTSATAADGVHEWAVTVTFASGIPAALQGGTLQIVLTTSANNARYYAVPGATGTIPASSSGSVGPITVNIADSDLTATATDVTFYQNLLTQDLSGNPPFKPWSVFTYSSRMAYCTYDLSGFPVVYFSDQNNYQSLTAAYHGIYLEGRQTVVTGVSLGAVCYLATLSGLYNTQDNGGYPGTWTPPARIDGSVGVLAPSNMIASGGKVVLASEKGLFFYRGGAFPQIPISYWQQPDWQRINWNAPTQVQIVDDELNRVVRVMTPLSVVVTGATNTNPITITTAVMINGKPVANPNLFQSGLSVTISGVGGNTNANTTQNITVVNTNQFTIPVAGNGAYTGGGIVTPNTPNAEMSWNYSEGEQPGQLYYSLNAFFAYRQGTSAIIRNTTNNLDEVWYAPSASNPGGIVRKVQPTDSLPNRDVDLSGTGTAVVSQYETGLSPGDDPEATVHDFQGAHMRVSGSGNFALAAFGVDHKVSTTPAASPITLSLTPGTEYLVKWWLRNEQQSIVWAMGSIDSFWVIAMLKVYWMPSLPFR